MPDKTEDHPVIQALRRLNQSGNSFVDRRVLFKICCADSPSPGGYAEFTNELDKLAAEGKLYLNGNEVYLMETWKDEEFAAACLAGHLRLGPHEGEPLPEEIRVNDIMLDEEQRMAVRKAGENDLTCIIGCAGSGKSATACALIDTLGIDPSTELVLCAPTGKAARNLCEATGYPASTLHKALHMLYGGGVQEPDALKGKKLIVVDEAGMMPLHPFAELLKAAPDGCKIVLLGDRNQLQGIGAGNVLADLLELGVSTQELHSLYRQKNVASALYHNVACFPEIAGVSGLLKDESFQIRAGTDDEIRAKLVEEAVQRYGRNELTCVITPRHRDVPLGSDALNALIREELNPLREGMRVLDDGMQLRNGDLVMVTANDAARGCFNGDIGILHVQSDGSHRGCVVRLNNGNRVEWTAEDAKRPPLELAYAMTVHKAQGSGYDTVLIPLSEEQMGSMLSRNLFYTAISRAKERVILFGTDEAIDRALRTRPSPRNSNLAAKTQKYLSGEQTTETDKMKEENEHGD